MGALKHFFTHSFIHSLIPLVSIHMLLCAGPRLARLETLSASSLRLLSLMGTQQLKNHRSCEEIALALGR